jgi:hypothetical protein
MASITRKSNSPYWIACIKLPDGRRSQRSTKSRNRRDALRIALELEEATLTAEKGRLSEKAARDTISAIYEIANGDSR